MIANERQDPPQEDLDSSEMWNENQLAELQCEQKDPNTFNHSTIRLACSVWR